MQAHSLEAKNADPRNANASDDAKPTSIAYVNTKTIYFTLYRRARVPIGARVIGDWIPISRAHALTPERVKMVRRVLDARKQAKEQTK